MYKFLIQAGIDARGAAQQSQSPDAFLEGVEAALRFVQQHLAEVDAFNPAHVGRKKAEVRRIRIHQAEQGEANAKAALRRITELLGEDPEKIIAHVASLKGQVKALQKQLDAFAKGEVPTGNKRSLRALLAGSQRQVMLLRQELDAIKTQQ